MHTKQSKGSANIPAIAVVAVVLLLVAGAFAYFSVGHGRGGTSNADAISLTGSLSVATDATEAGTLTVGTNGSGISQVVFGTCNVVAYSNTIAGTTTATVDCSTNGTPSGTITGITSTTDVIAHATTSLSSVYNGLDIVSSYASSTKGIITLQVINGTGATFTWTVTASTSIRYIAIK